MESVVLLHIERTRVKTFSVKESISEMTELIDSSGGRVVECVTAKVDSPSPASYVRSGKLAQTADVVRRAKAQVVIVNVDLSPTQLRNMEKTINRRVVDRTGLILDIFARHAKTREGKLQIELAQMNYLLPRLSDIWEEFSRTGGGIGTRGPGEQKLEVDRRKIKKRIARIKEELENVRAHRARVRSQRRKNNMFVISLVGYTNAGKSTLLNTLTGATVLAQDKLFATLDPTTRKLFVGNDLDVLVTDTVGFLRDLPHALIESFKATLEEITESDLIIEVVDCGGDFLDDKRQATNQVLKEIGADMIPRITVFNKIDTVVSDVRERFERNYPDAVCLSARSGDGIDVLRGRIEAIIRKRAN